MASPDVQDRIIDLMREYRRVGIASVSVDELALALKIRRTVVSATLQLLLKYGWVHYAKKNPRSAQPRYTLNGGLLK